MMRRIGSTAIPMVPTTAAAKSVPSQAKRGFIGSAPSVEHFGPRHPRGGSSGSASSHPWGTAGHPQDHFSSSRSAPLGPEDLFRKLMRHQQQQREQRPTAAASTAGATAKKPTCTPPSSSAKKEAQASAAPSETGSREASPQHHHHPVPHPFMGLFETLGEVAPLTIHESLNHSTVEVELPTNVEVKNPKVSIHRPDSSSSSSGAETSSAMPENLVELLTGQKPQRKDGNVTVSAELAPKLTVEQKMQHRKESDRMKAMLQQWGLPLEDVNLSGLEQRPPESRKFERTFFIDENTYNLQEATPFVEDGMLRLYVPKKKFTSQPRPQAAEDVAKENEVKGHPAAPEKTTVPSAATATTASSSASSSQSLRSSVIPEDLPKRQEVVGRDSRFSWAQAARPAPAAPTSSTATTSPPVADSPLPTQQRSFSTNSSTAATVNWPPHVETDESAKAITHTVSIPSAVDADTIALDLVEGEAKSDADLVRGSSSVLKLHIQQESTTRVKNQGESVVRTFYQYFEVAEEVDVEAVTCDFDAATRELTVRVPKPEPKKASPAVRRISITKKN